MNETPDESVDRLRNLLRQRGPLTAAEQDAIRAAQQNSLGGMARFNQTLPADVANLEPLESGDGEAVRGLVFAVLLVAVFGLFFGLGCGILYLITK